MYIFTQVMPLAQHVLSHVIRSTFDPHCRHPGTIACVSRFHVRPHDHSATHMRAGYCCAGDCGEPSICFLEGGLACCRGTVLGLYCFFYFKASGRRVKRMWLIIVLFNHINGRCLKPILRHGFFTIRSRRGAVVGTKWPLSAQATCTIATRQL